MTACPNITACGLEPTDLRRVFAAFPTGVTAVAALVDGVPAGITANSFTSVSLDPPIVSVSVAHTSTTWPVLRKAARLGISVLGAHQERHGRALSERRGDRFDSVRWWATADGAVMLEGTSAWLDCGIEREIRIGDHDLILLRVYALDADPAVPPLIFHASRYRRLTA
jgi:flavin reductase (DIM6/NTAB) family NADH-FMN oxidoreductase RutF